MAQKSTMLPTPTAARKTTAQKILRVFRDKGGWLRQKDLRAAGFHARWLSRLTAEGAIERVRRGLYRVREAPTSEHQGLIDACHAVPDGVICLLSALVFHGLTTVNPPEVYIAIERKARVPRVTYPPIRFLRFSPRLLALGRRRVSLKGGTIEVFDEEKTLCDCVRHRGGMGKDVVLEALKTYLRRKSRNIEKLLELSLPCHVENQVRS